jgi:hypothetical protein
MEMIAAWTAGAIIMSAKHPEITDTSFLKVTDRPVIMMHSFHRNKRTTFNLGQHRPQKG